MLKIPCGKEGLLLDETGMTVLRSRIGELKRTGSGEELVRRALAGPIGSPKLSELARGKKTCTVIISDHTRPVPSRDILPPMLEALRLGNPDIDITLLVATGFHRLTKTEELEQKLGSEIFRREKIAVHDSRNKESNVRIGTLPSGAPLVIDRLAAETELLVSEGFIEPHFFAGFSGGRKSVLPGICDQVTVLGNHCSRFIDSPYARTGNLLNNPIHADMLAAGRLAKLAFIVNVVIDERKQTVAAFAGDMEKAHEAGCAFLRPYCEIPATGAEIVITSNGGAPLDQNIYQCVKGLTAAEACGGEGSVLILCAGLADGHGGESFYRTFCECDSPEALYAGIMQTPQQETVPDQWESQILARVLMHHPVIFVAPENRKGLLSDMKLGWAPDLLTALAEARRIRGEKASVTVIPDGVSVIVKR